MKRDLLLKTTKGDTWTVEVDVSDMLEVSLHVPGVGLIRGSCDWTKDVVVADDLWRPRCLSQGGNEHFEAYADTYGVLEQLGDACELLARLLPVPPKPGVKEYPVVWHPSMHAVRDAAAALLAQVADYQQEESELRTRWERLPESLRASDPGPMGRKPGEGSPGDLLVKRYVDWCVEQVQDWALARAKKREQEWHEERDRARLETPAGHWVDVMIDEARR